MVIHATLQQVHYLWLNTMPLQSKQQIRRIYRQRRNQLTPTFQKQAAVQIAPRLMSLLNRLGANSVACYLANDGEVNLSHFITACWNTHTDISLPIIHPFNKQSLLFLEYIRETELQENRFGIAEPPLSVTQIHPILNIDIILMPLVAFTSQGSRLGMGGGFYDRSLAGVIEQAKRPTLIGIAHDCQQASQLPHDPWDIPMDGVITPTQTHLISQALNSY